MDEFRQDMLPEAERTAKTNFMLEKLVEEKGFELTDEEIEKQIEEIATQMNVDVDQAKQNLVGVMDKIVANMKIDKAIEYLINNAVISNKEEAAPQDEGQEAPEE
jgi:trigger factor